MNMKETEEYICEPVNDHPKLFLFEVTSEISEHSLSINESAQEWTYNRRQELFRLVHEHKQKHKMDFINDLRAALPIVEHFVCCGNGRLMTRFVELILDRCYANKEVTASIVNRCLTDSFDIPSNMFVYSLPLPKVPTSDLPRLLSLDLPSLFRIIGHDNVLLPLLYEYHPLFESVHRWLLQLQFCSVAAGKWWKSSKPSKDEKLLYDAVHIVKQVHQHALNVIHQQLIRELITSIEQCSSAEDGERALRVFARKLASHCFMDSKGVATRMQDILALFVENVYGFLCPFRGKDDLENLRHSTNLVIRSLDRVKLVHPELESYIDFAYYREATRG